jgi:hypothetical protein
MHRNRSFFETILRAAENETGVETKETVEDTLQGGAGGADTVEGGGAAGDGGGEDTLEGASGAATLPKPSGFASPAVQQRIDQLTKNWRGTQEELEVARQALIDRDKVIEDLRANNPEALKGLTDAEIERLAEKRAEVLVAQRVWLEDCKKVYDQGMEKFPGGKDKGMSFDDALKAYIPLGGASEALIRAAMDTESPDEVLYALAHDLDEAQRIMRLPPMKMAIACERMMVKAKAKVKQVSKTPPPPSELGGRNGTEVEELGENTDMKTWMAKRDKQVEAARKSGRMLQ